MALSARLRNVDLTLQCERCGRLIIKKGGWFICDFTFKCDECKGEVRLPYSDNALRQARAPGVGEGVLVTAAGHTASESAVPHPVAFPTPHPRCPLDVDCGRS